MSFYFIRVFYEESFKSLKIPKQKLSIDHSDHFDSSSAKNGQTTQTNYSGEIKQESVPNFTIPQTITFTASHFYTYRNKNFNLQ